MFICLFTVTAGLTGCEEKEMVKDMKKPVEFSSGKTSDQAQSQVANNGC